MKKLVAILLSLAMVLSLAACGSKTPASTEAPKPGESTAAPKAEWPKGNIDIIVPFKAGGAMDLSARLTADYLKKYLNVEVTVQNVEGGANWVGYNQILAAKGDGYTLGFANYPGQIGGYLDPSKKNNVSYRDFTNIADIVHDPGIIVVREDSPYKTLQDLLDAAKGGKKLTISTGGGPGSDDDVLIRQINSRLKIDTLIPGGNENDGEAKNALLNKEADAQACNVSNYFKTYESTGQTDSIRVLAIFDANKQVLMPNAPLIDDLNIAELKGLYSSSDRGLVACKALDPAVLQLIVNALKQAQADPDFQKDAAEKGMGINMLFGDDFNKFIDGVESTLIELAPQIGWDVDASKYGK